MLTTEEVIITISSPGNYIHVCHGVVAFNNEGIWVSAVLARFSHYLFYRNMVCEC